MSILDKVIISYSYVDSKKFKEVVADNNEKSVKG